MLLRRRQRGTGISCPVPVRSILRQNRLRYISIIVSFSVALPPHPGLLQRTAKTKRRKALSMGMWNSGQSRAREHMPQIPARFPAAPNVLALPGGNGIFTATPTKRITHYTLLRKVVCQMGALPPLETPTRKGGTLPLHGAHTAFSCYPALRLYRLSKSQRGISVVSLSK